MVIGGRQLIAAGLGVVFLAGCAGAGLRDVGVPGPFLQRAAQEEPRTDALGEMLQDWADDEAKPSPSRWQGELETAASARLLLFSPVLFPGRPSQEARWRCELRWRCYDTDDDTGERTELIDSGTAWYEGAGSRDWVCSRATAQLSGGSPCNTGHPDYYELEKDEECSCSRPGR